MVSFSPRIALAALAVLMLLVSSGSARAQDESFTSVAGVWWFRLAGKDAGALLVELSEPSGGVLTVTDIELTQSPSFGFSRELGAFFEIEAGQELSLDSKGNLFGTLTLSPDLTELVIEGGKPTKHFTVLKLRATLEDENGEPLRVKLLGRRVPVSFPVLTGIGPEIRLGGKGIKSKAYELSVRSDPEFSLPAYAFEGNGPVRIDGEEESEVAMAGRFVLAPDFRIWGLLEDFSDFDEGQVSGKLHVPESSDAPKIKLTARADRNVSVKGKLTTPVQPVLSVAPSSISFGAVRLDATLVKTAAVTNVGVGMLSGAATFESGSSPDFRLTGETTWTDLEPGDPPVEIEVTFDPSSAGSKTAEILFRVEGGIGSKIVDVSGDGGVAGISVDPELGAFGEETVGEFGTLIFTVTNSGDLPVTGVATLLGATDFALLTEAGGTATTIPYSLAGGEEQVIRVRFTPASTGQKTGTLNLTGGGGLIVPLTGAGVTTTTP